MSSSPPEPVGLRERKKVKTRRAIQHHALRLFAEHGYERTTVEAIAAAAEISPSTFFRYYPSKEDVVVSDDYDPLLVSLFAAQPAGLAPLASVRRVLREALSRLSEEEVADVRARARLMASVPALRARLYDNLTTTTDMLAQAIADLTGRSPDDPAVRTFAGACVGVWTEGVMRWIRGDDDAALYDVLDESLGYLEKGLPL